MLDLPAVPSTVTQDAAGLQDLEKMKQLDDMLWSTSKSGTTPVMPLSDAALLVERGIFDAQHGKMQGLEQMRQGIRLEPTNLVLANAYRMVVFGLRRDFLAAARRESTALPHFPPELERNQWFSSRDLTSASVTRNQTCFGLGWVDEMLLFPALEIKAPSQRAGSGYSEFGS